MSYIKDEVLIAYADGALDARERHAVERLMQCDPQAAYSVVLFKLTRAYTLLLFSDLNFESGKSRSRRSWKPCDWSWRSILNGCPRDQRITPDACRCAASAIQIWIVSSAILTGLAFAPDRLLATTTPLARGQPLIETTTL